jgi:hypothetical protein
MKRTLPIFGTLLLSAAVAPGTVILSENFGTATVNPTATTFTAQNTWNYSDSVDTTVNANASRLFTPAAAGSGETTHGWISSLAAGNTFQQIQTNQTFAALPTLSLGESYQITLTWYAAAQTNVITSDLNAYVNFASAGNGFTFTGGSNGAITTASFVSQTLADSNAAADALGLNFVAQGGPSGITGGGYNTDRTYTATFTTTDDLNGDAFSLILGRTTNVSATPFVLYDNVTLDVSVVPEPSAALLGGLGLLALLRRKRS